MSPRSEGPSSAESARSAGVVVYPSIPVGSSPTGIAVDTTTGDLYVANGLSDNVTVINGATNQVSFASIPVGSDPTALAFDSSNGDIYVANNLSDNVTVISGATNTVVAPSIPVGHGPDSLAVDSATGTVDVVNWASNSLSEIDTLTNKVQTYGLTLFLNSPAGITFDSSNDHLYVSNAGSNSVEEVDGGSKWLVGMWGLLVGSVPTGIAFDRSDSDVFVVDSRADAMSVINTSTDSVVSTLSLPYSFLGGPGPVALDSLHGCIDVVYPQSSSLSVVNDSTRTVGALDTGLSELFLGGPLGGIVFDPVNGDAYVTDQQWDNVTVVRSGCTPSPAIPSYPVTFSETGISGGYDALWRVHLGSAIGFPGAPASNITLDEPNGTYHFSVPAIPTGPGTEWAPSPVTGNVTVNGSLVLVNISFVLEKTHGVAFREKRLPPGVRWSVLVGDLVETNVTVALQASASGSEGTIMFQMANGPTQFRIDPAAGYGVAAGAGPGLRTLSSGEVTGNTTWSLSFGALEPFNFTESNLEGLEPYAGASWSVAVAPTSVLGGGVALSQTTNGNSLTFVGPVGADYRFSVTGPGPEYKVVPSTGGIRVTVGPAPSQKTVKFILLTSRVIFKESGLPRGTEWTLTITDGSSPVFHYPFGEANPGPQQIVFHLPAGTYSWLATASGFSSSMGSGTISVAYPSTVITVDVQFGVSSAGCFVFTQNGTPLGGPTCNPNANDILVDFAQVAGGVCAVQFMLGGANLGLPVQCPVLAVGSANQLEVNWSGSSSGPVVTSCYWALSGTPIGTCPVPSPPSPTGFVLFLAEITSVGWTVNGQGVGASIPAPAGANGIDFFS